VAADKNRGRSQAAHRPKPGPLVRVRAERSGRQGETRRAPALKVPRIQTERATADRLPRRRPGPANRLGKANHRSTGDVAGGGGAAVVGRSPAGDPGLQADRTAPHRQPEAAGGQNLPE